MTEQNKFSTNLGLSVMPQVSQQKYPEIFLELLTLRQALKTLQGALDTYTGALSEDPQYWNQTPAYSSARIQNIARFYCTASVAISLGQLVDFTLISGTLQARLAAANIPASAIYAKAFCNMPAGVAAGNTGEFILLGVHPYFSGLTPGDTYYLSTTPGTITNIAPGGGVIVQPIGYALSPTDLWFNP